MKFYIVCSLIVLSLIAYGEFESESDHDDESYSSSVAPTPTINDGDYRQVPDGFASAGISLGGLSYASRCPDVQVSDEQGGADLDPFCAVPDLEVGCPSLLDAFEPLPEETGMPVPHLELFPEDPSPPILATPQQLMPGPTNLAQAFNTFVDRSFVIEECEDGLLWKNREVDNFNVRLDKGEKVSCDLCHRNFIAAAKEYD